MRRTMFLIGAVSSILLGIGVFQVSGQGTKRSAAWTADSATLKRLGTAVAVEKYTLRIPKGYDQQEVNPPPGMRFWGWAGEARKDGTKPSITMYLLTLTPAQLEPIKSISLEQLAEKLIGGEKKRKTNWKQGKAEKGVINGMNFVRIRWEGTEPTRNWDMRGFVYVALDDDTIVHIASQDLTKETEKALPLAETAVLTFKKR